MTAASLALLAACGSAPKQDDPALRRQALDAEREGAQRHARGDHAGAAARFAAAAVLQQSLDDETAAARNRLHQARAELALGKNDAALERASATVPAGLAVDAALLRAQAALALGRAEVAGEALAVAEAACPAGCAHAASLHILHARAALAGKRPAQAQQQALAALALLEGRDEPAETGNAWRILATARLAAGDGAGALPAAQAALDVDRRLALPEKIARDWLLIGDIRRKVGAGDTAQAYRRALAVAEAAGLAELAQIAKAAQRALDDTTPAR